LLKEFNTEVQTLFLRMMITNPELYTRVMNIMNPKNFDRSIRPAAEFIVEHSQKYNVLPDPTQIKATTGIEIEAIPELDTEGHTEFFLTEFENFTKRQELERAILKAAELLEKGEYDPVEKLVKDAVQISLQRDMGTDYFADPKERLNKYFNQGGQVSTGWPQLDRLMYGGFSRGELNVMAGGSGSGKSLLMMNLAVNLLSQGLSGIYVTLELSEELAALRMDAMITGMSTKEIRKDLDTTELKVKIAAKKHGRCRIKYFSAQSNINVIRSYVKELQIQTEKNIDFIMVDYLDLLSPATVKVGPSDIFIKDKYVSEELRNLAKELGVILVTASQLNRSAVEEAEFDHSHIAGGISKINSSDYVFGIFTSRSMKERGKYQIQCMKSRSSTGVGQKIELEYNMDTMRITDEGGDENASYRQSATDIMSKIKPMSTVTSTDENVNTNTGEIQQPEKKIVADVQGTKLRSMLNSLKNN
jgi:KaiC/GvpD/RAD55 family RecA-like ATPase